MLQYLVPCIAPCIANNDAEDGIMNHIKAHISPAMHRIQTHTQTRRGTFDVLFFFFLLI
jgi:hypothetical protein